MSLELPEPSENQEEPGNKKQAVKRAKARVSQLKNKKPANSEFKPGAATMASKNNSAIDDTVETPVEEIRAAIADVSKADVIDREEIEVGKAATWEAEDEPVLEAPEPQEQNGSWMKGGLIMLALGLIVASFMMGGEDSIELDTVAAGVAEVTAVIEEEQPAVSEQAALEPRSVVVETTATDPVVVDEGQKAREFIASVKSTKITTGTLDQVYAEADALRQAGALSDSYLLYFFAARQGHGSSAMHLAVISDPLQFNADNGVMDEPAPFNAYRWYSVAAQSGLKNAKGSLDKLKNWAQTQAKAGNQQAERLLLQWR